MNIKERIMDNGKTLVHTIVILYQLGTRNYNASTKIDYCFQGYTPPTQT